MLSTVDFIAAEDTRVTLKLLNHLAIKKPMVSYHEHNKVTRHDVIADRIEKGESCALVTDAGMPAISDPGEDLVRYILDRGIEVESVPGPPQHSSRRLPFPVCRRADFCFEGFLSVNKPSRREHLLSLKHERRTLIFYEAPHKLVAALRDMADTFGDRNIALVKELYQAARIGRKDDAFFCRRKVCRRQRKGRICHNNRG